MFQARIPSLAARLPSVLSRSTQLSSRTLARPHCFRTISTTRPTRASEAPKPQVDEALIKALQETEAYKKLSKSQSAIEAIKKFMNVLQKSGVDTTSGKRPSMLQMSKLMLNSEFRDASKNMIEEFQKAGLDPTDKAMIDELTNLMKMGKF
ncbi:hypothetical protein JR316_0005141 [Psilocybe cubensis]|uniref:Uncharacterized protein n=2 Tax=Psilocybe cubensis TaxID=181762 RepID=A0A8H8CLC3_PSICU|nr:hypothetical protein JR316_0005141 [Psilocybe cubensis]KAH9483041.1 hypothetical protein JR316_0005141 [Psilocybe cubensis]